MANTPPWRMVQVHTEDLNVQNTLFLFIGSLGSRQSSLKSAETPICSSKALRSEIYADVRLWGPDSHSIANVVEDNRTSCFREDIRQHVCGLNVDHLNRLRVDVLSY